MVNMHGVQCFEVSGSSCCLVLLLIIILERIVEGGVEHVVERSFNNTLEYDLRIYDGMYLQEMEGIVERVMFKILGKV